MNIGIIGLGLIGGSLAKSFKKINPHHSFIIGYDKKAAFTKAAFHEGSIDKIALGIDEDFSSCDVIFICTTVDLIPTIIATLLPFISPDCILTDIGSTKSLIVTEVTNLLQANGNKFHFIGGHPMAGSEKSGYFASTNHLFENAYYILTPSDDTPDFILFILEQLILRIGALPLVLSPSYHDFATASVSHLPHIIASSLVHLVKENDGEDHILHTLAAGGFKDITRIASSNPKVWQSICESNTHQIKVVFKTYINLLNDFYLALDTNNKEAIYNFFEHAKNYRTTMNDSLNGALIQTYTLYIDAKDEPGIIASIATLLSVHHINIKDIGIMKHREFNTGVLRICFENKTHMLAATRLLTQHQYTIYY